MANILLEDTAVAFWESGTMDRDFLHDVYVENGCDPTPLIPKPDHFGALRETAKSVARRFGLTGDGRIDYEGLAHNKDAVGIELRRVVKGVKKNDMPHLLSIGVTQDDDGEFAVEVLHHDAAHAPGIIGKQADVEIYATQHWLAQVKYLQPADVSESFAKFVRSLRGFKLQNRGNVWGLPRTSLDTFEAVAAQVYPYSHMHCAVMSDKVGGRLITHAHDQIVNHTQSVVSRITNELAELKAQGKKPRANGQSTRLAELTELRETLEANAGLLGEMQATLSAQVDSLAEQIGETAINLFA